MALTPPKKITWYLCILLWIIGVVMVVADYHLYGAIVLALSGILSIIAVYFPKI